jgi:hypothetical protein
MYWKLILLALALYGTSVWMILHAANAWKTGVLIETRKMSPIKDYYYRGEFMYYFQITLYSLGGSFMTGFATWLLMNR